MTDLIALVNEQAEDEGLWFIDATCSEAYLQAALRKLHAAIETASPSFDSTVQPVAWRWRHGPSGQWAYSEEKPEGPSIHLFRVEPLYVAPSTASPSFDRTAIPDGYVLMPREATHSMTMAACDSLPSCEHVFGYAGEMLRNCYRKMVEVAAVPSTDRCQCSPLTRYADAEHDAGCALSSTPRATGFFAQLTPEQQKAALEYDGPESFGDAAFSSTEGNTHD